MPGRSRATRCAVIVAALLVLFAGSARADAQPDARDRATEAEREVEARRLFEDGAARVDEGDLAGAAERYRLAYELVPRPRILFNLGVVLAELGRDAEAAEALARYLDLVDGREDMEERRVRSAQRRLVALERRLGRVVLAVDGAAGAIIRLDGATIGTVPLRATLRVSPGLHVIAVESSGGWKKTVTVEVDAGESERVDMAARDRVVAPAAVVLPPPRRDAGEPAAPAAPGPRWSAFVRAEVLVPRGQSGDQPGIALGAGYAPLPWLEIDAGALLAERSGAELGVRAVMSRSGLRIGAAAAGIVHYDAGMQPAARATAVAGAVTGRVVTTLEAGWQQELHRAMRGQGAFVACLRLAVAL